MAYYANNQVEIDITIRKIGLKPTNWTGERDQKPNMEILEESDFNKLTVREALEKLITLIN